MASEQDNSSKTRLEGWKEIADYFDRDETTVRRWKAAGLPVHRESDAPRARVFAYKEELERWRTTRSVLTRPDQQEQVVEAGGASWKMWALVGAILLAGFVTLVGSGVWPTRPTEARMRGPKLDRILARASSEGGRLAQFKLPVPLGPIAEAPDADHFFMTDMKGVVVYKVSLPTGEVEPIEFSDTSFDLELSSDGKTLYRSTSRGIEAHDLETRSRRFWEMGGAVSDFEITADGETLFAAMGPRGVWQLDLRTGEKKNITYQAAPYFLTLDSAKRNLLISYQNGGPGGRNGHDTVEIRNLQTGQILNSKSGPPMVAGTPVFSPLTGDAWVQIWDACVSPGYDHEGCPSVPAAGFQVFRGADLRHIRSVMWPDKHGRGLHFPGDGAVAMVNGPVTSVVDSKTFHILEELPVPTIISWSMRDGRRIVALHENVGYIFETSPDGCFDVPASLVQRYSFDGSLDDAIETAAFDVKGEHRFIAGRIGQALRLTANAEAMAVPPSAYRIGDDLDAPMFMSVWFRARGKSTILARDYQLPISIDWEEGNVVLTAGTNVRVARAAAQSVWHHLALAIKSGIVEMYLDGASAGALQAKKPAVPNPHFPAEYVMKGDIDIDELSVYAGTLTPALIETLRAMPTKPGCN